MHSCEKLQIDKDRQLDLYVHDTTDFDLLNSKRHRGLAFTT